MLYVAKGKETYSMETKNICGKIPIALHEKVRQKLEGTEMTIPQFLTQVITEHFESKGVEKMAARTLAVQVSEELFQRFKERYEKEKAQRPGRFTQKDYLIEIITQALDAADENEQGEELPEETEREPVTGEAEGAEPETGETEIHEDAAGTEEQEESEDTEDVEEEPEALATSEEEQPDEMILEGHDMEEDYGEGLETA